MKNLSFETTLKLILAFTIICGLVTVTFITIKIADEANNAAKFYNVTQNGTTYTGRIIRGTNYVKVTDKDDNMVILDAAHGPISIRRSDLMEHPIDVQHNPDTNL